jgi:predicted neuraminidase
MSSGQFVSAWFAGTREMHPDTAIWWSMQIDGVWTEPKVAHKVCDEAHWNPVLFVEPNGHLLMHFKVGRFPDSWDTYVSRLGVSGKWSKPKMLESVMIDCGKVTMGPVRNKMVMMSDGTIIAPSSIERTVSSITYPFQVEWNSIFHISKDGGKTWKTTPVVGYDRKKYGSFGGIIQPAVWESNKGVASALFRSTTGYLFRSDSVDGGTTWSDAVQTDVLNPNSAIDVATRNGVLAMVYNPVAGNWARRAPLSITFSGLDGKSFGEPVTIHSGPGSYAYPSMIATDYGFAMTYTWSRRRIAFVEIETGNIANVIKHRHYVPVGKTI